MIDSYSKLMSEISRLKIGVTILTGCSDSGVISCLQSLLNELHRLELQAETMSKAIREKIK